MPIDRSGEVPRVTLSDGVEMPLLGFGTSGLGSEEQKEEEEEGAAYEAIKHAIRCGYRFFDTAALYGNEALVGRALNDAMREGLVDRRELFVCTKLWNTAHERPSVARACRDSLRRLQLDYVDLYLVHWPCAYADYYARTERAAVGAGAFVNPRTPDGRLAYSATHFTETWRGMEDVRAAHLTRSIGVSNFSCKMIEALLAMPALRFAPTVNQVESHPYLGQARLLAHARARSILVNAYSPLGAPNAAWLPANQPKVLEEALVLELAQKYARSPAQVLLKFQLARGVAPIPKSATPARIEANIRLFDFELSAPDLQRLLALNRNLRYCINTAGELIADHPLYPFHDDDS